MVKKDKDYWEEFSRWKSQFPFPENANFTTAFEFNSKMGAIFEKVKEEVEKKNGEEK